MFRESVASLLENQKSQIRNYKSSGSVFVLAFDFPGLPIAIC